MKKILVFTISLFFISNSISYSHSGGLNGQGCHNNNKTGGYHCHRSPGWNTGSYPYQSIPKAKNYLCKLTIGNQYYEFDPSILNNKNLKFDKNDGDINLKCE